MEASAVPAEIASGFAKADVELVAQVDVVQDVGKPLDIEPIPSAVEKLRLRLVEEGMEFFSVVLETASVPDPRPEPQAHVEKVEKYGQGVCSKRRWLSGCLQCDVKKA